MRQRTLGIVAAALLVGGVGLGAATAIAAYQNAGSSTAKLPLAPGQSRYHQWPFGPALTPRTGFQPPGPGGPPRRTAGL